MQPNGSARELTSTAQPLPGKTAPDSGVRVDQTAASFSFFSARTLTFTVAGLAANICSSPVNGFLPLRFGLAATLTALILNRPGRVKWPTPFLCTDASTADSRPASTALTAFA